jgi:hypothetical protein
MMEIATAFGLAMTMVISCSPVGEDKEKKNGFRLPPEWDRFYLHPFHLSRGLVLPVAALL